MAGPNGLSKERQSQWEQQQQQQQQQQQRYIDEKLTHERMAREASIALLDEQLKILKTRLDELCGGSTSLGGGPDATGKSDGPTSDKIIHGLNGGSDRTGACKLCDSGETVVCETDNVVAISPHEHKEPDDDSRECVERLMDLEYQFAESTWDAAMFVGLPQVGFGASLLLITMFVLNLLAQFVFIAVTIWVLSDDQFENYKEEVRKWRITTGHSHRFYDAGSDTSLVQRVCSQAPFLEMSTDRASVLDEMNRYWNYPDQDFRWGLVISGPGLAAMALLLWFSTLLNEMRKVRAFLLCVCSIPCGKKITQFVCDEEGWRFAKMSIPRRMYIIWISAIRLAVCGALGVYGTRFLLNTVSLGDLILNCVALEVVLNIDEILFSAFSPNCMVKLMGNLAPIRMRQFASWRGLDLMSAFWAVMLVAMVSVTCGVSIGPIVRTILDSRHEMCGGTTNFVYASDPYGVIFTFRTRGLGQPEDVKGPLNMAKSSEVAVEERVWPEMRDKSNNRMSWEFDQFSRVKDFTDRTMPETTEHYQSLGKGRCQDLMGKLPGLERYVTNGGSGKETKSCLDVKNFCSSSAFVRAICPITCGCDDPLSDLFLSGIDEGCPRCNSTDTYRNAIAQAPCTDEVPSSPRWQFWADQVGESAPRALQDVQDGGVFHDKMLALGCAFEGWYRNWMNMTWGADVDPCSGRWELADFFRWRPWATTCPETCRCNQSSAARSLEMMCPLSCSAR